MAIGTSLGELVAMLKAETGRSMKVSAGVDETDALKHLLARQQRALYAAFDWPHLRVMTYKPLVAGQRYYDMPADLNVDRVEAVALWWNGHPHEVERGIGFAEYASHDSDADERCDPVRRWDVRWTGFGTQVEVWPIPASNGMRLHWRGIRPLRPLVAESDTADLDDDLLVLFAAAKLLARQGSKDAPEAMNLAQAHFATLRGNSRGGSRSIVYGGGGSADRPARGRITIRAA